MKKIKYIIAFGILLLMSNKLNAQLTDLITGVNGPYGITFHENYLYVSVGNLDKISKIDFTSPNPTLTDVVTGLNGPDGLAVNGNYLYIAEYSGNKISKIDLTVSNPVPIDVITGVNGPVGLIFIGNDLYIGVNNEQKIAKINVLDSTPTLTTVININQILGATYARNGNDLYIPIQNKISKIDISSSNPSLVDVITGIDSPGSLALNGNILYFSHWGNVSKISKIEINNITPTVTDITTDVNGPYGLALNGNDLYISEWIGHKISKLTNGSLGVSNPETSRLTSLYPNPAEEYIKIENLESNSIFKIYNVLGQEVHCGITINNQKIDVQTLSPGPYYIKINELTTLKFIKK